MDQLVGKQHAVDESTANDVEAPIDSVSAPDQKEVLLPSADEKVPQPTEKEVHDSNKVASEEWPLLR